MDNKPKKEWAFLTVPNNTFARRDPIGSDTGSITQQVIAIAVDPVPDFEDAFDTDLFNTYVLLARVEGRTPGGEAGTWVKLEDYELFTMD